METVNTTGSTEAREVAVVKYFTNTPSPPSYLLAKVCGAFAGVCMTVLLALSIQGGKGFRDNCLGCASLIIVPCAFLGAGIAAASYHSSRDRYRQAWHGAEPKPSDAQIDAWHAADLQRLREHALMKLDLIWEQVAQDNPEGPLTVVGPGPSPRVRGGADRVIRFSVHDVLVVYLTKYHLATYKCTIELASGVVRSESTQEYHYNDVVSISTQTDNSGLMWYVHGEPRQFPTYQKLALSVASGEQIAVAICPDTAELLRGHDMPESGADKTARVIRARLREKKGGTMENGKGADPSVL